MKDDNMIINKSGWLCHSSYDPYLAGCVLKQQKAIVTAVRETC